MLLILILTELDVCMWSSQNKLYYSKYISKISKLPNTHFYNVNTICKIHLQIYIARFLYEYICQVIFICKVAQIVIYYHYWQAETIDLQEYVYTFVFTYSICQYKELMHNLLPVHSKSCLHNSFTETHYPGFSK
jgi:hypothetical protein